MDEERDPGHVSNTQPANAVPFVVALIGFVIVAALAFVFLRADDEGEIVYPDRLDATGDETVRATVFQVPACQTIERAQVDLEDDRIIVQFVAVDVEDCDDTDTVDVVADITLPEPIDDRELVRGVGRFPLPCTGSTDLTCGPDQ